MVISTQARDILQQARHVWFQQVSLFPPTYNNRPNGNRPDLMQLLADMQPKFLRLPGGNYLEGDYINERFNWKKTIGDISQRPGHRSPWNYWSTDGFGLMEYLDWCEDLHMEPVLAVFAGYALRHDYVKPGPDLEPYVQDALDEIEYVTGDTQHEMGRATREGRPSRAVPIALRRSGQRRLVRPLRQLRRTVRAIFQRHQGEISATCKSSPPRR